MGQANSSLHLEQMRLPLLSQEQQPDSSVFSQNISSSEAGKRNGFLMCSGGCELSDGQGQDEHELKTSKNKLTWVVIFCLVFMSVEIAGGILSNSLAVLTDAAHLLSDVAGFAISLFAIWASTWEATARQSYGYHRLEVLGALVSIQIIWLITGIIVYKAIDRILNNFEPVNGKLMFLIATFGLVVNIVMMAILGHEHGHKHDHGETEHAGHSHAHNEHSHDEHLSGDGSRPRHQQKHKHQNKCKDECGHNHDYDHSYDHNHDHEHEHEHVQGEVFGSQHDDLYCRCKAVSGVCVCISSMERETDIAKALRHSQSIKLDTDIKGNGSHSKENINVRGAYLHVLGDLIQSIGVMIGGAVIWYKPEWKIVDLICTLLFSLLVMGTTIKMLRDILEVLMESTPRAIDPSQLENGLKGIEGVVAVHDLHIWAITVGKVLLACHVTINSDADADIALQKVIDVCKRDFKICHVTIQIERGINSGV